MMLKGERAQLSTGHRHSLRIMQRNMATYPSTWDSRAFSSVCRTRSLWRTRHIWHTPCRHTQQLKSSLHYPKCSADKVWNVATIDLQSFVLWPNFSINWGNGNPSGRRGIKRKFNFIFCGRIAVGVLAMSVLATVVFGSQAGGEPEEGVRSVCALVSLHPARLWRRTLPHFSLIRRRRKLWDLRHLMPETFRSVCFDVFKGKKVLLLNNISFTLVNASAAK